MKISHNMLIMIATLSNDSSLFGRYYHAHVVILIEPYIFVTITLSVSRYHNFCSIRYHASLVAVLELSLHPTMLEEIAAALK